MNHLIKCLIKEKEVINSYSEDFIENLLDYITYTPFHLSRCLKIPKEDSLAVLVRKLDTFSYNDKIVKFLSVKYFIK